MSNPSAAPSASTPAQASPPTNSTGGEHPFRGGGRGRGRGRGRGNAGGREWRWGRFNPQGRGRFGTQRGFRADSDGKYQELLILGVGVPVRKEEYKAGYIQNFFGEYGDIARCIDSSFTHPNDEAELTWADTVMPNVDDYDWRDPSSRPRYDAVCQQRKELKEFFQKRAFLHGKVIAKLSQEVHERMLDQYPPEFFGGETPTWILMDAIYEKMVPAGVDNAQTVKNLRAARLLFKMRENETPREYVQRAKELKAQFEIFGIPFEEEEFVNDIMIPGLTPAYAEVSEQRRKFKNYPRPDPADLTATAQYMHLVEPVTSLDQLTTRLQKVHVHNPFEYVNLATQQSDSGGGKRSRYEHDGNPQRKRADKGKGKGKGGGGKGDRAQGSLDHVKCHRCGRFGHKKVNCPAREAKQDVVNFFDFE